MNSIVILPVNFVPGPKHIVCQRGKNYWDHEGNKMFRAIIAAAAPKYAKTTSKLDKSLMVSEIIQSIRLATTSTTKTNTTDADEEEHQQYSCFIKLDNSIGRWVECDDLSVREKISQSLRDGLQGLYRSSTSAKLNRRKIANESIHTRMESVFHSNSSVSRIITQLSRDLERHEAAATLVRGTDSSQVCSMLMSRANLALLEAIKKDDSLQRMFQEVDSKAQ
jgi:hypothetical protein